MAATLVPTKVDRAIEPARVWPVFERLLPWATRLVSVELVERKEGRALLRYRLDTPTEPVLVMAKLYSDEAQAARVFLTMRLLNQEVFATTTVLTVPEPIGWDPELAMVLYRPVKGVSLDRVVHPEERLQGTRAAARWLSVLHGSRVELDRRLDVAHETVNAARWAEVADHWLGPASPGATHLARRLGVVGARLSVRNDVPIHKDFHHHHTLLGPALVGPTIGVIDLDEARLGDPTFDLAHFCANLCLLSSPSPTDTHVRARVQQAFLDEYTSRTGWQADERFAFFSALTSLKMAKQLATGRGPAARAAAGQRRLLAIAVLHEGHAWLAG